MYSGKLGSSKDSPPNYYNVVISINFLTSLLHLEYKRVKDIAILTDLLIRTESHISTHLDLFLSSGS